jgi:hypothetical protein
MVSSLAPQGDPALPASHESFARFFNYARRLPVYVILGVQGSGTNLLRSVLAAAFDFCVVQDQSIVFNAAAALGPSAPHPAVRRQFDRILAHLLPSTLRRKTAKVVKANTNYAGIQDHLDASGIQSGAQLAQFVYAFGAFKRGTTLMAVKSDDLWEHIDAIDAVIPNRRLVLLTRDFRDNLLSITRKDFGPIEPLVAAQYVHDRFERYQRQFDRTAESDRLHLRYEDLLADPHGCVARFSSHFGVPLAAGGDTAVGGLAIRRNNRGKWGTLDPATLAGCEAILRRELQQFGYGVSQPPGAPTPGAWALARSRDVLKRVPQKIGKVSKRLRR